MKGKVKWGGQDDRFGGSPKGKPAKMSATHKGKQKGGAPFKEGKVAGMSGKAWSEAKRRAGVSDNQ